MLRILELIPNIVPTQMVMMNSNVNVTKDLMGKDVKISVPWNAEFTEVAPLKSMVLLVLNSGNAFVGIISQVLLMAIYMK